MLNAEGIYPVATAPFPREAHFRLFMLFPGVIYRACGWMIVPLWAHTLFFALILPLPGVLDHTPAFAQPLALALASLAVAEATDHRATTGNQAGAPLAVPFSPRTLQAACLPGEG